MIALWFTLAFADTRTVAVGPGHVVVYADRARVTRTASVELPAGVHSVVFEGLPATLLDSSVVAELAGSAELGGIDLRRVTASEIADVRVSEIEAELEKLGDARRVSTDDESAATAVIGALESARTAAAKALSLQLLYGTRAAERERLLRTKLAAAEELARDAQQEARRKGRDLDTKMEALRRERSTLGTSGTDTYTATVRVDVARAGSVTVDLSYLVSGATWRPRYDVRGQSATGKVDVALSALVTQTSGEDWTDVKLSVTTARAGQGTDVPVLDPFWLEPPQYYPRPSAAPARAMAAPMAPMAESAADEAYFEPEPMQVAQAVVQLDLSATTFEVARKESIPADGSERKVLLTTQALDSDLRYVVVPRIDPGAYLVGKATNTADFALLEGEAGAFLDDAYLGDFTMPRVAPGAEFDVAFGIDDAVHVERHARDVKVGNKALVGKRATSKWSWDVKVANGHDRPIQVEVREQVPVSGQGDVQVTWKTLDSTPAPVEEPGGILVFTSEVPARAQRVTSWSYSVEYPSDRYLGWLE